MIGEEQECHEDIGLRGGPCGMPAVGYRMDEEGEPYPVCWEHVRPVMVSRRAKPPGVTVTCHLDMHTSCPGKRVDCECPCHTRKKKGASR